MEWNFSDHRGQQAEWFRQKKHNDQNAEWTVAKYAFYRSGDDSNLHSNVTSSLPLTNHWFQTLPFLERNNPPPVGFMGDSNAIDPSRGRIEAPKTPPSFRTASFRQRCMASEPISPPNPLRLATTSQDLPRPDTSPRFLRCIFPRFDYESVGDPDFLVFKVKLPDYLIHGPLDALIVAADQYASRLPSGWKTNLFSLTKCDIACHDIPGISELVDPIMAFITKTMTLLYGCPGLTMGQNQPHIVKYAGDIGHTGGKRMLLLVSAFATRYCCDLEMLLFSSFLLTPIFPFPKQSNCTVTVVISRPIYLYRAKAVTPEAVPISPPWTSW